MGIVIFFVGALFMGDAFVTENQEFFDIVKKQKAEGYEWHYVGAKPLDNPPVPSLPLQVEGHEPYILWKLKKD